LNRKEILKLAIKAAEKRIEQLGRACLHQTCLLCQELSCPECPAYSGKFDCKRYIALVRELMDCLRVQINSWREEMMMI